MDTDKGKQETWNDDSKKDGHERWDAITSDIITALMQDNIGAKTMMSSVTVDGDVVGFDLITVAVTVKKEDSERYYRFLKSVVSMILDQEAGR